MPPKPRILPPPPRVIPPVAPASAAASPANAPAGRPPAAPKKETARINILPQPASPRAPTVKMTKTQPLLTVPQAAVQSAPVSLAKVPAATVATRSITDFVELLDAAPIPVCWTIFGISSVTLLIQIWNYLSS
ncbi:MAG: hypothetical protein M3032_04800 [Verrucomicrobiota bacterium]|nr:hypothetical protein [Verrucomicrobiota bacterium]